MCAHVCVRQDVGGGQYLLVWVHILSGSLCKDVSACTYVWRSIRVECVGGQCLETSRQHSS